MEDGGGADKEVQSVAEAVGSTPLAARPSLGPTTDWRLPNGTASTAGSRVVLSANLSAGCRMKLTLRVAMACDHRPIPTPPLLRAGAYRFGPRPAQRSCSGGTREERTSRRPRRGPSPDHSPQCRGQPPQCVGGIPRLRNSLPPEGDKAPAAAS